MKDAPCASAAAAFVMFSHHTGAFLFERLITVAVGASSTAGAGPSTLEMPGTAGRDRDREGACNGFSGAGTPVR
jgi:hypothetical protein